MCICFLGDIGGAKAVWGVQICIPDANATCLCFILVFSLWLYCGCVEWTGTPAQQVSDQVFKSFYTGLYQSKFVVVYVCT